MRRVFAVLFLLLGIPLLLAGAAAAALVGPAGTVSSGTHHISSRGSAIVTASSVLRYVGPTLHVTASASNGKSVFIGVGHRADVRSYLAGSSYTTVTGFRPPWRLTQDQSAAGGVSPVPRPAGLPFWVASASGPGHQELSWPTTDGDWNVVLTTTTPSAGQSFDVSVGVTVRYLFEALLAVAAIGLLLCVLAIILLRRPRRDAGSRPSQPGAAPAAQPARHAAAVHPAAGQAAVQAAAGSVAAGSVAAGAVDATRPAAGQSVAGQAPAGRAPAGQPAAGQRAAAASGPPAGAADVTDVAGPGAVPSGAGIPAPPGDGPDPAPPGVRPDPASPGVRPVPADARAGEPPWAPAPPPPSVPREGDTGPLARISAGHTKAEPGELFRKSSDARRRGPARTDPPEVPVPSEPEPFPPPPVTAPSPAPPGQPSSAAPRPEPMSAPPAEPASPEPPAAPASAPVPADAAPAASAQPGVRGDLPGLAEPAAACPGASREGPGAGTSPASPRLASPTPLPAAAQAAPPAATEPVAPAAADPAARNPAAGEGPQRAATEAAALTSTDAPAGPPANGPKAQTDAPADAAAGFRAASGWPGRSAPLDPLEQDAAEDPESAAAPANWAGASSANQFGVQPGQGPQWVPGSGPPPPAPWTVSPGAGGQGTRQARRRPPEAAHGDEWAPPARQRPGPRPDRTAPEE